MTESTDARAGRLDCWKLCLISFAALFFEVLFIRWVASEIRIFAFMKNLGLMACVLGLGLGCATVTEKQKNTLFVFLGLLLLMTIILAAAPAIGLTNMTFVFSYDLFDWQFNIASVTALFLNVICLTGLFILIVATFDMLGRQLGQELEKFPPLKGYGVNLGGSLLGVAIFSLLCFLGASPPVWLLLGLLSLFVFCNTAKQKAIFAVTTILVVGLAQYSVTGSIWSPYYRIDLEPGTYWTQKDKSGNCKRMEVPYQIGTIVKVNHMEHQGIFNRSTEFTRAHPEILQSTEYKTYDLPYADRDKPHNVLIVGAGTGNDVASALAHGAEHVDAVEIDPGILATGQRMHPQHPYQDPRVSAHVNDARSFLSFTDNKYDTIVFGHLDSQTALSVMPSVRLDNYLYTKEGLEKATKHLSANGIAVLGFSSQPAWLQSRLYQLVKSVYGGREPLVLLTGFGGPNSIMLFWGPGLDAVRPSLEKDFANQIMDTSLLAPPVEMPTDDWPYIYQKERNIPPVYIGMIFTVLLISTFLVFNRFKLKPANFINNAQFFFLGAGFLLLETRGMLVIASIVGSTWIVNSIVVGILLLMAMLANALVSKYEQLNEKLAYAGLAISLFLMWLALHFRACLEGNMLAVPVTLLLIGLPFIWTGIIFSRAFSRVSEPRLALGINILGAILGGCLEYLSTITGTSGLTWLAIAIYTLSFLTRAK